MRVPLLPILALCWVSIICIFPGTVVMATGVCLPSFFEHSIKTSDGMRVERACLCPKNSLCVGRKCKTGHARHSNETVSGYSPPCVGCKCEAKELASPAGEGNAPPVAFDVNTLILERPSKSVLDRRQCVQVRWLNFLFRNKNGLLPLLHLRQVRLL